MLKPLIKLTRKFVAKIKLKFGYGWQEVWQRCTEKARKAIIYAGEEAQQLGHTRICTNELLLGLTRVTDSFAACLLKQIGVSLESIRQEIKKSLPFRSNFGSRQIVGLTFHGRRAIELAIKAADEMGDVYIDTGHLLLGLLLEKKGGAAQILSGLGVNIDLIRIELTRTKIFDNKHK